MISKTPSTLTSRFVEHKSVGYRLAGGFILVILLGLLSYFRTVEEMQAGARRSQSTEAHVHASVSLAKDVVLASHDTASYTLAYVYNPANFAARERKWEAQDAADSGFDALKASLQSLPRSAKLRRLCAEAAQTNTQSCRPLEVRAISLTEQGRGQQARALLEEEGTATRYRLEIQLAALVDSLEAYGLTAARIERSETAHSLYMGWTIQGCLLALSLVIAIAVTRRISAGMHNVQEVQGTLRESEARYRLLFEKNPHPMWVYDCETLRFLAVNRAAVQHYGYSEAEFLALTILDIRPTEDKERVREVVAELSNSPIADRTYLYSAWRHRTSDGRIIWVDVSSMPMHWDGRAAAIVIAQDVTSRREAEEGMNRMAAIVHSSQEAIVGWSSNGQVTSWNPGAERLYGYRE